MDSPALLSFLILTLFLFTIISLNTFSSYASQLTYTDHCASIVPNSTPNESKFKVFPHGQLQSGYYLGGDTIVGADSIRNLRQKQVTLRIKSVYETNDIGIYNVGASLVVRSATSYYRAGNSTLGNKWKNHKRFPSSITFRLDGFWSESSGKLCLVGTGTGYRMQPFEVVLKLYNVVNSSNTISTSVIGSLESLSSKLEVSYFEPISLFFFPRMDYEYSLDTNDAKNEFSNEGGEVVPGLSINSVSFCSNLFPMINGKYDLQYNSDCNSAKNCSPIRGDVNQLPYIVSLKELVCSDVEKRVRVLIGFRNSGARRSFNPNTTLVGEGWWDEKKNQLCIVACRFLGMEESVASVHVGDCSTRMSLRFPKIWSIKGASSIVGQIWSNKTVGDSGYFKRMTLRSFQDQRVGISSIKYEYSQLDKVRKFCPRQEPLKNKGIRYPDVYSSDMRFDMSVRYSRRRVAWGYSVPLVVNDQIQQWDFDETFPSNSTYTHPSISENSSSSGLYNVSYIIRINLLPNAMLGDEKSMLNTTNATETVNFSAEGIYDAESGSLCMVGCRIIGSKNKIPTTNSMDCEIIVKFQFSPLNAKSNGGYTKGSIESTRKNSDPLNFMRLDLTSAAFYAAEAARILRRINKEVIMILVCTMLACVFVGLQLYHVKKNPDMLPTISRVMLLILTLGNMIPLVLNFEAIFTKNHEKKNILLGNEWLEVNEIVVRVIVMVAFLLQLRLLQLTWSARKADRKQNGLWSAEKKVLYVIFPLYAAGFLIAFLLHQNKTLHDDVVSPSSLSDYQQHPFWEDLKSYSGLILDGFLLPQILLNLFWNSKGYALSCSFYFGISLVRLLPHAYDLFEALVYVDGSSLYEDEIADFYSTAWDIVIPLVSLMFAVIIYLQQQFGGRSILCWRIKGIEEYEKVPVVTET